MSNSISMLASRETKEKSPTEYTRSDKTVNCVAIVVETVVRKPHFSGTIFKYFSTIGTT